MYDITGKSMKELQQDMISNETTALELTLAYLKRIEKYDKQGIAVNAVAEINPDALLIADAMDRERRAGKYRGTLHGIPIMLKDNISTHDKMRTTAGSIALKNNYAREDAAIVKKLRDAGAVILGKLNMTEFANFMTMDSVNGFSSLGGQVKNPHDVTKDVSGSSSGSAVAAACEFCCAAVGTETNGSIISPSQANGVVGLKPTVGTISRYGIIPINNQDTAGPIGRSVEDCALLFAAMSGEDVGDPATWCTQVLSGNHPERIWEAALRTYSVQGMRIGVADFMAKDLSECCREHFNRAAQAFNSLGAICRTGCQPPQGLPWGGSDDPLVECVSMIYDFKSALDNYLMNFCSIPEIRTLEDIIEFNKMDLKTRAPLGQIILEAAAQRCLGRQTDPEHLKHQIWRMEHARAGLDTMFDENNVDIVLLPRYINVTASAGYPILTIPAGLDEQGMPYGICLISRAFDEYRLLAAGYAYEQYANGFQAPKLDK